MKKLKLLIASCALLLGGMTVSAETNYTSLMPRIGLSMQLIQEISRVERKLITHPILLLEKSFTRALRLLLQVFMKLNSML